MAKTSSVKLPTLADRIRHARATRGLTQEELALRSGLKQSDISKIENGHIKKTTGLPALARALRCDLHWLDTGEGQLDAAPSRSDLQDVPKALRVIAVKLINLDATTRARCAQLFSSFAQDPEGPWVNWLLDSMLGRVGHSVSPSLATSAAKLQNGLGTQTPPVAARAKSKTEQPLNLGDFDTRLPTTSRGKGNAQRSKKQQQARGQ